MRPMNSFKLGPAQVSILSILMFSAVLATFPTKTAAQTTFTYTGTKINVSDVDRSVEFYTKLIGLKVATRFARTEERGEYLLTPTGKLVDDKLTLVFDKTRREPPVMGNQFVNLIFGVTDLKQRVAALKAAGYKVHREVEVKPPFPANPPYPPSVKSVALAFTRDPDGIEIELVQWNVEGNVMP